MNEEFVPAYQDLQQTTKTPLHPLDDLYGAPMENVLNFLHIWLVDGSKEGTRSPDFNISNYNILNGGEMLGVGFTVPRLHVTHMVRSGGQGQMDTIQQRGRFFGYCGSWFDKIRVWVEDEVKESFEGYVDEEEFLRRDLKDYDDNNKQLKGWKVRLRLNPNARPTRRNAIRRDIKRFKTNEGWISQTHWLSNPEAKKANIALLGDFLLSKGDFSTQSRPPLVLALADADLRGGEAATQHFAAQCDLDALRLLIADFAVEARDRDNFAVALETLDEIKNSPELYQQGAEQPVDVFVMAHGSQRRRRRAVNKTNHHVDLFQGENNNYIGDRKVHSSRVSLQIHYLDHGPNDQSIEETNIAYIALWLPTKPREWAEKWIQEV